MAEVSAIQLGMVALDIRLNLYLTYLQNPRHHPPLISYSLFGNDTHGQRSADTVLQNL